MDPAPGMFLVASPQLTDPNFLRSVVLVLEHDGNGTLGVIINRPLTIPLRELWAEVPPALAEAAIAAEGGPVERGKGLLLHGVPDLPGAQPVGLGLALGGSADAIAQRWAGGPGSDGPRLFLGHSGWSEGQLAAEIGAGAWIVRPGRLDLALSCSTDPELWQRLLAGRSGLPRPSLN